MVKIKHIGAFMALCGLITFTACNNDDSANARDSRTVNDFVWRAMNSWYYWQTDVPNLNDEIAQNPDYFDFVNGYSSPEALFDDLLYQPGVVDRFSWIESDYQTLVNQLSGISTSFGFDYGLYIKNANDEVVGYVQYVVPDSPAATAGLQRGDTFTHVNGIALNRNNFSSLLDNDNISLGLADVTDVQANEITTSGVTETLEISKANVVENPVHYSTVLEQGSHRIGYLVYNGFRDLYNDELNQAIGEMATQGITALVLDLRYNGGGSLNNATAIASMITGQFTGQNFVTLDFNQKHNQYDRTSTFVNQTSQYEIINNRLREVGEFQLNQLGLNELYVLTTSRTASASELLINSLEPYIDVTLIGTSTTGKFVGSITLVDSPSSDFTHAESRNMSHNYAIQPIVFAYQNSQGGIGSPNGLTPDVEVNERDYLTNIQSFGSLEDPFLNAAVSAITGAGRPAAGYSVSAGISPIAQSNEIQSKGAGLYLNEVVTIN